MLKLLSKNSWGNSPKWNFVRNIRKVPESMSQDVMRTSNPLDEENQSFIVLDKINAAENTLTLLNMLKRTNKEEIEPKHLSIALNRLYTLEKHSKFSNLLTSHSTQLTQHEGFGNMCHLLKFKGPRMESNDLINCLKVLAYFGLNSDNLTVQRILQLIKDQINDLMPNNLMFLSFLLKKMNKTSLTEALLIAIPIVFDLNCIQRIDRNNTVELSQLLHYLTVSSSNVSHKILDVIFSGLKSNLNKVDVQQAKSIVWSISAGTATLRGYNCDRLYQDCIFILNQKIMDMSFNDVHTTLIKIIENYHIANYQSLQILGENAVITEGFLERIVSYIIVKDVGYLNASYILMRFNKIKYVSHRLLDYIGSNPANLSNCDFPGLLTFVVGFSNAVYKTENWEIIKTTLYENPLMCSENMNISWLRFAVEMMSLDLHSNILFEKIFSTKYLQELFSRKNKVIDYNNLLLLWQSVKLLIPNYDGPLPDQEFIDEAKLFNIRKSNEMLMLCLAEAFGGFEFVQTDIETSYGHHLDYVISFDNKRQPIAMPSEVKSYEELLKNQGTSVAVFLNNRAAYPLNMPNKLRGMSDLRRRTIEALGIKTVQISPVVWDNLLADEKLDFLEREILYASRI